MHKQCHTLKEPARRRPITENPLNYIGTGALPEKILADSFISGKKQSNENVFFDNLVLFCQLFA
jgi:hypothetical protein